ncbi:hypothetical protein PILCRDRAFT_329717 [Piloderma croceum F 1598]|uniref:Uncharacterized protein n=1 Tax=Piloderma croceum (strain F 1598) TaxID=765440 RepID=A0A0C3C8C8_PILCF|nr:hypothetical protein PILCRDRAFT_329717 [Piloderma croceum F 1598]
MSNSADVHWYDSYLVYPRGLCQAFRFMPSRPNVNHRKAHQGIPNLADCHYHDGETTSLP